jgi:hypothetical protein
MVVCGGPDTESYHSKLALPRKIETQKKIYANDVLLIIDNYINDHHKQQRMWFLFASIF